MYNTCPFNLKIECFHEAGHYIKLKYDWLTIDDSNKPTFPVTDTGYFKDWTLVQIQGEERVQADTEEGKASGKQIAAQKKPEPKKGANARSGQQLEEITDNRPREIAYEREFTIDNGEALEVTEDVA